MYEIISNNGILWNFYGFSGKSKDFPKVNEIFTKDTPFALLSIVFIGILRQLSVCNYEISHLCFIKVSFFLEMKICCIIVSTDDACKELAVLLERISIDDTSWSKRQRPRSADTSERQNKYRQTKRRKRPKRRSSENARLNYKAGWCGDCFACRQIQRDQLKAGSFRILNRLDTVEKIPNGWHLIKNLLIAKDKPPVDGPIRLRYRKSSNKPSVTYVAKIFWEGAYSRGVLIHGLFMGGGGLIRGCELI